MDTETKDASNRDGWSAWMRGRPKDELAPRLRLLYHCDLARLGTLAVPGTVAARWLVLGRSIPAFGGLGGATLSLDDPQVSREQLRIRWLADAQRFEVEPIAGARRRLGLVDLDAGSRGPRRLPITGSTLLAPGRVHRHRRPHPPRAGAERASTRSTPTASGSSARARRIWALRDEIESVAQFGRSALVNGPTGAGKELVARALHRQSPRAAGPFVPVNCAALPQSLVEAVLFGHKKGAFTGADVEEKGLFRAADGGTLFLDELGELPLAVQPKLLRVLQDGTWSPVGAHEGRQVDVRVVAATHRDLWRPRCGRGSLREDLYHRMAAHVLRVPSLAERRFDVPELFVHVLGRLRAEHPPLDWLWAQRARVAARPAHRLHRRPDAPALERQRARAAEPGGAHRAAQPAPRPRSGARQRAHRRRLRLSEAPRRGAGALRSRPSEALLRAAGETLGPGAQDAAQAAHAGGARRPRRAGGCGGRRRAERASRLRASAAEALSRCWRRATSTRAAWRRRWAPRAPRW